MSSCSAGRVGNVGDGGFGAKQAARTGVDIGGGSDVSVVDHEVVELKPAEPLRVTRAKDVLTAQDEV